MDKTGLDGLQAPTASRNDGATSTVPLASDRLQVSPSALGMQLKLQPATSLSSFLAEASEYRIDFDPLATSQYKYALSRTALGHKNNHFSPQNSSSNRKLHDHNITFFSYSLIPGSTTDTSLELPPA